MGLIESFFDKKCVSIGPTVKSYVKIDLSHIHTYIKDIEDVGVYIYKRLIIKTPVEPKTGME